RRHQLRPCAGRKARLFRAIPPRGLPRAAGQPLPLPALHLSDRVATKREVVECDLCPFRLYYAFLAIILRGLLILESRASIGAWGHRTGGEGLPAWHGSPRAQA